MHYTIALQIGLFQAVYILHFFQSVQKDVRVWCGTDEKQRREHRRVSLLCVCVFPSLFQSVRMTYLRSGRKGKGQCISVEQHFGSDFLPLAAGGAEIYVSGIPVGGPAVEETADEDYAYFV